MKSAKPDLDRTQQRQRARFERMGLAVRPMPDGRSLLVSVPFGAGPLESVATPLIPRRVVFSTVGPNQIKCLRPRALFGLPLIDVRHCVDADSIESTIRQAWRELSTELGESRGALHRLGIGVEVIAESSALAFPLAGEAPDVKIMMRRLGEAILPSTGPLSGLALENPGDRVLEVSDCLDSASDLECRLGQRMRELRDEHKRASEDARSRRRPQTSPNLGPPAKMNATTSTHRPKVLIVGPRLVENEQLIEEFERQGYRTTRSRDESDALKHLSSMTPDLVVSQYMLGRSDGAALVQGIIDMPGVERIPVILLDDVRNETRRQTARAVGALGYLTEPVEARSFVTRIRRVIQEPGSRRFTRYPLRLAARLEGAAQSCLVTELGRGGVFIATSQVLESHCATRCKMVLPDLGRVLIFEGEVRYCAEAQGMTRQGIGLRFFDMSKEDESTLIDYLGILESNA